MKKKLILALIYIVIIFTSCYNDNTFVYETEDINSYSLTKESITETTSKMISTQTVETTDNTMETSVSTSVSTSSYSLTGSLYNETTSVITTILTTDMTELSVSSLVQPSKIDDSYYEFIENVFEYQNENLPFFKGTDTRYSFYDFNKDGIDELLWLTSIAGMNLLDIPLYIVFNDGYAINVNNDFYITESVNNLISFDVYKDISGNAVYRLTTDVYSTGEQRNCIRFFDKEFNLICTYLIIETNGSTIYCISTLHHFDYSEYSVDENEYYNKLYEYARDLEMIQNLDFHELKSFGPENINDYFISD
jgi:hypothetical protein